MQVRQAHDDEREALLDVARRAFPDEDVVSLVKALLDDPDMVAQMNLVAEENGVVLGHIMFSRVRAGEVAGVLLAPLGVIPEAQGRGVGTALVRSGLAVARELGHEIVLVLGHPGYYPRMGFEPATPHGIFAPHPIEPAEAWMVAELAPGAIARAGGVVQVAQTFAPEELWRE